MFAPNIRQVTIGVAAGLMLALPAFAESVTYTAEMTASSEVPPTESTAMGTADVTIDKEAHTVSWVVEVKDLTGDATAAHIHGPADETENAPPVITMSDSLMEGQADITDEQIADLEAGKYYVNVHTEKYPDGEIRGQLKAAE